MNTHISPAIIMRFREFGESDLVVTFFTADRGILKGVAKGARRSRRRFPNCLDLFCLANVEYELKKRGSLHFLHSCRLLNPFPELRSDFSSLSLASYMVELTEILFPEGVADSEMYELLKNAFLALNGGKRTDILRVAFEIKAMALGGYGLNLEKCCECGRPYREKGRAVFKRSKGGIACQGCEKESVLSPGLGPGAVREIKGIDGTLQCLAGLPLSEESICEIRPILDLHIEYRIGRRLKASSFLE